MKVYKKHTSLNETPYLDNCYLASSPQDLLDENVTSTKSLFAFVPSNQIDYIQYRDYCKQELLPSWTNLVEEEKQELVRHNIAPNEEEKMSNVSDLEHRLNFFELLRLEKQARYNRWEKAKKFIAYEYRLNPFNQLLMYQDTKPYKDDYIDADLPYLIHWVGSTSLPQLEVDFILNGFASKSYYSESVKNTVLDILLNNQ